MINSIYLNLDEEDFFRTIVNEKKSKAKNILVPISIRVLGTFVHYIDDFPNISAKANSEFTILEAAQRLELKNCYENETRTSKSVKGEIFAVQPDVLKTLCPYCMLDRPRTLDHYIPKNEFPEYAMFVKNLIPCCYDCNNKKDELWRTNTVREFIHYHNDHFLTHQFLYSELTFSGLNVAPRIRHFLRQPAAMSLSEYRLVQTHFRNLELLSAYDARLNDALSSEIEAILEYIASGLADPSIINILERQFRSKTRTHGINYYETVLYQTLQNHLQQIKLLDF